MPLELGIFLGAKRFGGETRAKKSCLILGDEPYLYQAYLSDIVGQDIEAHSNTIKGVIRAVRRWAGQFVDSDIILPSPASTTERFGEFTDFLEEWLIELRLAPTELTFPNYCTILSRWLSDNPR